MPEGVDSLGVNMDPAAVSARETLLASLSGGESSKLAAVKRELDKIWKLDKGSKVLIFSQYLGFLDILGISLRKEGIPVFRLDGQMSLKERVAALDRFNKAKSTPVRRGGGGGGGGDDDDDDDDLEDENIVRGSVFLASMKAGGVGINLVAASSVFILDPWWNFAIEDQCINRIHRIGQKAKIVRVRKFVVNDSVEEKIVRLQQTKKSMASDILDAKDNADGSDAVSGNKPTLDDFKILLGR
jgi:SNF2 family DNA or RNA helicase